MARAPASFRLPADPVAALTRQLRREWRAGPLHHLVIDRPKTDGLAIRPRDLRPADAAAGERLLAGEFGFSAERIEVGRGGDPWRRALPSRRFAVRLHAFDWMRDLIAAGEAGQREALRLWLEWRAVFGRYNEFAWSGEALERRVFNLAASAAALAPLVSEVEGATFVADLARQARHLLGDPGDPGRAAERAAAAALVGAALNGKAGEALRAQALPRLERLLPAAVLRDGVHASRSPERGLELLFDLLALDDALSQLGAPRRSRFLARWTVSRRPRASSPWPTAGWRRSRAASPARPTASPPRSPSTPPSSRRRSPSPMAATTGWSVRGCR